LVFDWISPAGLENIPFDYAHIFNYLWGAVEMEDCHMTTLETRDASPDLKAALRGLIADQMAEALSGADIDLADDAAVVATLSAAGFTARTIRPLYAEARARAMQA
jgi:type III secretion system FlhB-like substrate exporter